jgi:hypothetical protein
VGERADHPVRLIVPCARRDVADPAPIVRVHVVAVQILVDARCGPRIGPERIDQHAQQITIEALQLADPEQVIDQLVDVVREVAGCLPGVVDELLEPCAERRLGEPHETAGKLVQAGPAGLLRVAP